MMQFVLPCHPATAFAFPRINQANGAFKATLQLHSAGISCSCRRLSQFLEFPMQQYVHMCAFHNICA